MTLLLIGALLIALASSEKLRRIVLHDPDSPVVAIYLALLKAIRDQVAEEYRACAGATHGAGDLEWLVSTLPHKIGFSRIGTSEEGRGDRESVKEAFSPFFEELASWLGI